MRLALALFCSAAALAAADKTLDIYAIDTEGGKATLYVSPTGASMLVDAGYGGNGDRDAKRIAAAIRDAGLKQIDYMVVSHYHVDHVGGLPALAALVPIRHFVDHGPVVEAGARKLYEDYLAVSREAGRTEAKPGSRIPVPGLDVQVVTSAGQGVTAPLPGAGQPNPLCATYQAMPEDKGENARSVGMIVTYGKFRAVDLGDLYWNQEFDLACAVNRIGTVDVYMSTHHAKKNSGHPQIVWALHPKVAVVNNGAKLGSDLPAWQIIHDSPGIEDIWQLHYALANDAQHNAPEALIANPREACNGDWIKVSARADGSFTVRNGRTGFEKSYR